MKKKLDTRFPAARIKKIMQADEDIGKIAMAVPVLVSKALELFLQDLCDRTYDITLQRGAKTMNSLHLKHCVEKYTVFDFLGEIVSKVPDYSNPDVAGDDKSTPKRRKTSTNQGNDSDEDSRRGKMPLGEASSHPASGSSSSTGRGRARGRGRGRGGRFPGRQPIRVSEPELSAAHEEKEVANIDLNTEALGKGGVPIGEEYHPWPVSDFNTTAMDRVETEEEEEDYDEE